MTKNIKKTSKIAHIIMGILKIVIFCHFLNFLFKMRFKSGAKNDKKTQKMAKKEAYFKAHFEKQ